MVGVRAGEAGPGTDLVDRYLDRLLMELRGRAPQVRRILAEVEDHLRDAVEAGVAEGLSPVDAEARALARFGSPATVARRFARTPRRLAPAPVLSQLVLALIFLAGVGLVAVGISGALAGGMGAMWGKAFVAGDPAGTTYTPTRCADFAEYHPEATTCARAAAAHHFDEVVQYRLGAGVLGMALLGCYLVVRRSRRAARLLAISDGVGLLPHGFVATVGTAVFGVGAVGLLGQSLGQMVGGDSGGAGAYLSGGLVSLAFGLTFLSGLHHALATGVVWADGEGDSGGLVAGTAGSPW